MISRDEQPAEVSVRAPIVFEHVPPDLEVSSESIPEAQIRVRGPERVIRQLQTNEVQARNRPCRRPFRRAHLRSHAAAGSSSARRQRHADRAQPVASGVRYALESGSRGSSPRHRQRSPKASRSSKSTPILHASPSPAPVIMSKGSMRPRPIPSTPPEPAAAPIFTTNVYVSDPLVQVEQATRIRVTVVVQKVGSCHLSLNSSRRSYVIAVRHLS